MSTADDEPAFDALLEFLKRSRGFDLGGTSARVSSGGSPVA
jgi:hypothetical protein